MSKQAANYQSSNYSGNTPNGKDCIIWSYDENGNICVNIPNCVTGADLKIHAPEQVVTGIKFPGDEEIYVPDTEGCITLPADKFATGVISGDGTTLTLTVDGVEGSVDICLNPVKGAVIVDADGNEQIVPIIDGILQFEAPEPICWGRNEDGCPVINITNCITGEDLVLDFVTSVTGNIVTGTAKDVEVNETITGLSQDGASGVITYVNEAGDSQTADTKHSTTVPGPAGFHTITTDDGVATAVCLNPLKSINGVTGDINGNVNVQDLFSNTVDNGDGTYTTTNSDGTPVTWSGDTFASQMDNGNGTVTFTMADGSAVTLCLNPVKSIVQNADGNGATVTYADGTTGQLTYPQSTAVTDAAAGTTTTTHPDGTTHTSCDNPVKDVLNADGDSLVEDGVAQLPPDLEDWELVHADNEKPIFRKTDNDGNVTDYKLNAISRHKIGRRFIPGIIDIDPATAIGTTWTSPNFVRTNLDCIQDVTYLLTWGIEPSFDAQGSVQVQPSVSKDGGATFTAFPYGNVAAFHYDSNATIVRDIQHTQPFDFVGCPAGVNDFVVQWELISNDLVTGTLTQSSSNHSAAYNQCVDCCEEDHT